MHIHLDDHFNHLVNPGQSLTRIEAILSIVVTHSALLDLK